LFLLNDKVLAFNLLFIQSHFVKLFVLIVEADCTVQFSPVSFFLLEKLVEYSRKNVLFGGACCRIIVMYINVYKCLKKLFIDIPFMNVML
jgi:hypothetical protein